MMTLLTLAFFAAISIFTRSLFITCMTYTAGKKIHREMIHHVMNAPINLFFDVTPTGVIVNRFSNDMGKIEEIYMMIMWIHCCAYGVIQIIVVIIMANWYLLIIFPFMTYYLIKIYKFTIGSYCEMSRLSSVTRSPILTHLGESISGNSTIRAFGKRNQFLEMNYKDMNNQILVQQMETGTCVWYSTQMNNISIIVITASSLICVLFRQTMNPVLLAMVF